MDNGPEFISTTLAEWADEHDIELDFIQPRKPTQNSYVERFKRTYPDEALNMYVFRTLNEVRDVTQKDVGIFDRYYWVCVFVGKSIDLSIKCTDLMDGLCLKIGWCVRVFAKNTQETTRCRHTVYV